MANGNNVPLGAYIDPLLRVDWSGRYISLHQGYFTLTRRAVVVYIALVILGLVLSLIPGVRYVNWVIGLAVQIVGLSILFMPGNFVAAWILGFIAGQLGGEKGFDIKDGADKSGEFGARYARFVGYVTFFGGLPFMALGLFHTWSNPVGALIALVLSLSLTIGGIMLFESAKAFMRLVWFIYLLILLWILAGFVPGLKELQEKVTAIVDGFVQTRIVDNPADGAKKKSEEKQRIARIKAAKDCFEKLSETPKPADQAKCDTLHAAIDRPLFEGTPNIESATEKLAPAVDQAKGAVEELKGWVTGVSTSPDGKCYTAYTGVYEPSITKGRMPLGDKPFCAGKYRYEMEDRGIHQQAFSNPRDGKYTRAVDCNGNDPNGRGVLYETPKEWLNAVPLPEGPPYGACFLRGGDALIAIGSGMEFTLQADTPVAIDKNIVGSDYNYSGPGKIRIRVTRL